MKILARFIVVSLILVSHASRGLAAEETPPNILFVFADDWGWGDLSCHGHPYHWVAYAIVDQNWKLLANEDLSYCELYDIATDRYENTDQKSTQSATAKRLLAKIRQWKSTLPQSPSGKVFSTERTIH